MGRSHLVVQEEQLMAIPASEQAKSIGDYLIRRLQDCGVRDVFGLPGDYVLTFYTQLDASPLNVVGCTREDCAGFAAAVRVPQHPSHRQDKIRIRMIATFLCKRLAVVHRCSGCSMR